jgi:hypothetical protein
MGKAAPLASASGPAKGAPTRALGRDRARCRCTQFVARMERRSAGRPSMRHRPRISLRSIRATCFLFTISNSAVFFGPGSFCLRILFSFFLFAFVAADPRVRGLAERPETSSLDTCRAVTRDATLARHEPSRATGRHASRRSAVALSAQVPLRPRCRVRREGSTPPAAMGWLRCRASRVRSYQPRSTPHPAPPSGSPRESAPHERDIGVVS